MVDDRFAANPPVVQLPHLAWFGVYCATPPGTQFWNPDEGPQLDAVEGDLIKLCGRHGNGWAAYVHRLDTPGLREYYVYFGGGAAIDKVLPELKAAHPGYRLEFDRIDDLKWSQYLKWLGWAVTGDNPPNAVAGPALRRKFVLGIVSPGASRWPPSRRTIARGPAEAKMRRGIVPTIIRFSADPATTATTKSLLLPIRVISRHASSQQALAAAQQVVDAFAKLAETARTTGATMTLLPAPTTPGTQPSGVLSIQQLSAKEAQVDIVFVAAVTIDAPSEFWQHAGIVAWAIDVVEAFGIRSWPKGVWVLPRRARLSAEAPASEETIGDLPED